VSDAEDHDFGGFNEGGGTLAGLEAHFLGGVGGDDGSDVLFANGEGDLGKKAAVSDGNDSADELIAAGNLAKIEAAGGDIAAFELLGDEAVDFGFRDAMVATGSLCGLDLTVVDPLFEGGIANAEDVGGFARGEESLHENLRKLILDELIRMGNTDLVGLAGHGTRKLSLAREYREMLRRALDGESFGAHTTRSLSVTCVGVFGQGAKLQLDRQSR